MTRYKYIVAFMAVSLLLPTAAQLVTNLDRFTGVRLPLSTPADTGPEPDMAAPILAAFVNRLGVTEAMAREGGTQRAHATFMAFAKGKDTDSAPGAKGEEQAPDAHRYGHASNGSTSSPATSQDRVKNVAADHSRATGIASPAGSASQDDLATEAAARLQAVTKPEAPPGINEDEISAMLEKAANDLAGLKASKAPADKNKAAARRSGKLSQRKPMTSCEDLLCEDLLKDIISGVAEVEALGIDSAPKSPLEKAVADMLDTTNLEPQKTTDSLQGPTGTAPPQRNYVTALSAEPGEMSNVVRLSDLRKQKKHPELDKYLSALEEEAHSEIRSVVITPYRLADSVIVQKGDTLSTISERVYGNAFQYLKLYEANKDILKSPNLLRVGMKLRVPR